MHSNSDRSVEELRQQSERTRAALGLTVLELRQKVGVTTAEIKTRVSPAYLKNEVRTYIRDERDSIVASLEQKARDNPLQAAAIGTAIAYPLFSLLRAFPKPLLLIGAGLWLTGKQGKRTFNEVKRQAADAYEQGTSKAAEYLDDFTASSVPGGVSTRASGPSLREAVSNRVADVLDSAKQTASGLADSAAEVLDSAKSTASEFVDNASEQAARLQAGASEQAARLQAGASEQATRLQAGARASGNTVVDFVKQNPLLVAGVGAVAGAFIAASIPSSTAENRLFGAASSGLKRKAREAAAEGLDMAKKAAGSAVADVAVAAAREGLNQDGLRKAAETLVGGVKSVAERGLSTVVGDNRHAESQARPGMNQNQTTGANNE